MKQAVRLFLKALGAIYLIAFVSFGVQAAGLIGSHGLLPVTRYLQGMHQEIGARAYWYVPTIFWINSSDIALQVAWIVGAILAILLMLGLFERPCLMALFVLYLSISTAGQDFWSFQWDILLTEAGFLAIFLDASYGRVWLFRWLLFRLMFMSGLVKLTSGDPTWRNLTALFYHYETQPLPTPIAWYMYQLPGWAQRVSTAVVLCVEFAAPFLVFAPLRWRRAGAGLLVGLQLLILLTGNYTFFNWLTIALCIFLLPERPGAGSPPETRVHRAVTVSLIAFVGVTSGLQLLEMASIEPPAPALSYLHWISPLRIVNTYGLFAVMTTTRLEIIVEGSNDGTNWQAYEFPYKPGDVKRAPAWVAPYQPRLDWQMWFAALGAAPQNPWFYSMVVRLMQGSPQVLGLLEKSPFSEPPRYIRATVYDYQFTNFAERRATGCWWKREPKGMYLQPVSLRAQ